MVHARAFFGSVANRVSEEHGFSGDVEGDGLAGIERKRKDAARLDGEKFAHGKRARRETELGDKTAVQEALLQLTASFRGGYP